MRQTVLIGHPRYFRILWGANPHTRDRWGRRKTVDRSTMLAQWERFRQLLSDLGVTVLVLPPSVEHPGTVFPANAGLLVGDAMYLSRPNPARAGERTLYRAFLERHQYRVTEVPGPPSQWEGEADTFPVGDPASGFQRPIYLLTCGRLERQRWTPRLGMPPYRRVYGFRTDVRVGAAMQQALAPHPVLSLELQDERYYHGDTCLCAFGPRHEYLMAYLPALTEASRRAVTDRFGDRLLTLDEADAEVLAANAYQIDTTRPPTLLFGASISERLRSALQARGVDPCVVDVSEFLSKGGGSVKCMLLHLGFS